MVWFYLSMCFAAVYLDHHWVFDIVLGSAYTLVISALMRRLLFASRLVLELPGARQFHRGRQSELSFWGRKTAPSDRCDMRYVRVGRARRTMAVGHRGAAGAASGASRPQCKLCANLKSDVEELLPRNAPSVAAIDELRRRMPGVRYLGVFIDVGRAENLPAGERLVVDLAARVRKYPKELVASVRTGVQSETEFLKKNAPLYVDLVDLKTVHDRIADERDREVSKSLDLGLGEDEDETKLDFSDLQKKYHNKGAERFKNGRFSSAEQHATLMLIEVASFTTGTALGNALFKRVRNDLKELGGADKYAPGMRIGYTGDVAIDVEELAALVSDLSVSSVVVIILTLAVVLLFFRWWKSVFVLLLPLTLAALYAFALVTLPPIGIDGLNSNTAFLGSVIVGNGVNFRIIFARALRRGTARGASHRGVLGYRDLGLTRRHRGRCARGGHGVWLADAHAVSRLSSVRRDRRGGHDRLLGHGLPAQPVSEHLVRPRCQQPAEWPAPPSEHGSYREPGAAAPDADRRCGRVANALLALPRALDRRLVDRVRLLALAPRGFAHFRRSLLGSSHGRATRPLPDAAGRAH